MSTPYLILLLVCLFAGWVLLGLFADRIVNTIAVWFDTFLGLLFILATLPVILWRKWTR